MLCNLWRRNGRRKAVLVSVLGIALYLLLCRTREQGAKFNTSLDLIDPETAWEYVADFSHVKELNPTVIDFDILSERGNLKHWEYSVVYRETMSFIPLVTNVGYGDFVVKPSGDHYVITSDHRTCFFFGLFCLKTESKMLFSKLGPSGTGIEEWVRYECPWALTPLCSAELHHQRSAVWRNLQKHFVNDEIIRTISMPKNGGLMY